MGRFSTTGISAADTILALQKAAGGAGTQHLIWGFEIIVEGAGLVNSVAIQLKTDSAVLYQTFLLTATGIEGFRLFRDFTKPIVCDDNEIAELNVAAGGTSVTIRGNFHGETTVVVGTRGVG